MCRSCSALKGRGFLTAPYERKRRRAFRRWGAMGITNNCFWNLSLGENKKVLDTEIM